MRCEVIRLLGGGSAIVCGRGPVRSARCWVCGRPAAYQCDAPARSKNSGTCDRYLCREHRQPDPSRAGADYCPQHANQPSLPGVI